MKINFAILIFGFAATLTLSAQTKYQANTEQTELKWLGEKVTGDHHGTIGLKSGELELKNKTILSGKFVIDMTSIVDLDLEDPKWNKKLTDHLKSDDFFGVETYPTSTISITNKPSFSNGTALVEGDLTIKGITNPIEFKASMQEVENGIRFYANIVVDRSKFNVRYGSGTFFDNLGDKTIYDEFKLKVNLLVEPE